MYSEAINKTYHPLKPGEGGQSPFQMRTGDRSAFAGVALDGKEAPGRGLSKDVSGDLSKDVSGALSKDGSGDASLELVELCRISGYNSWLSVLRIYLDCGSPWQSQ